MRTGTTGMPDKAQRLAELTARNAALEAQLELYRDAVEHMHQAFCVFDNDGRIVLFNSGYAKVLQLPQDAVRPGVTIRNLIELGCEAGHYPEGSAVDELEHDLWASLDTNTEGRAIMNRGGRTYAVLPRRTAGGRFVGTFEDITAQVDAERAVRDSEAQLRAFIEAMPDCVKIFDESGRLISINPKGLELLEAPDLESLSTPGYTAVAPEYLADCLEVHRRVIDGESVVWTYEVIGMKGR